MHKIAVLGDKESVCGFACIGLETFSVRSTDEARTQFRKISKEDYAVIFVTEYYAKELSDEIEKLKDNITPAVILIPGVFGNTGEGMSSVAKSVERAVGSQILD